MNSYAVYVALAVLTIALPGPGVLLTVNNAAQRGLTRSFAGIFGISLGVLAVAAISATGLGVLLAKSATAFLVMKYIGAAYLIYLGIKVWLRNSTLQSDSSVSACSMLTCFYEGVLLSLSNPKSIIFFMSIFPQFIDTSSEYAPQFLILAVTFAVLIILVHSVYAMLAVAAKHLFFTKKSVGLMNRVSGGLLVGFGVGLAASKS